MQTSLDRPLRGLDPEATAGIEEAAAVNDSQRTDVLWPDLIRPQDQPVLSAQPRNHGHLEIHS
jgi:hypothetical protein